MVKKLDSTIRSFVILIACAIAFCSCSGNDEPAKYETDTYKISFSGDVEAFHASYGIYYISPSAYLYDSDGKIIQDFVSTTLPAEVQYFFKYKVDDDHKYIIFSCTALCLTDEGTKKMYGIISRERDGIVVDEAKFEIRSFHEPLNKDDRPNLEDYSFKIEI